MASSTEKTLLALDSLRSLQECGEKATLIAKVVLENHTLLGWNEILKLGQRGRLGLKKKEKGKIKTGFNTKFLSSPTGLDLSTEVTAVRNTLRILSLKKD